MLIQGLAAALILILAPLGTGMLIDNLLEEKSRSLGMSYIAGFIALLAVFQLVGVPIVLLDAWGFPLLVKIFTCTWAVLAGLGAVVSMHRWRRGEHIWHPLRPVRRVERSECLQWAMALALIGFQLVMAVAYASFDGDDAYYVAQSVSAEETNTLYRILPYTGLSTALDYRHSLAVFPLWIAYVSRMTGIHAAIVSHTVLPVILIPITYWIYLEVGKKLFPDKPERLPAYMLFVCALQIFGNTSIYPASTFFLTRTWQGKSVLANVVIPAVFMILLWLYEGEKGKRKKRTGLWILLFMVNIVAAMMSTASVFLNVVLLAVMAATLAVREKNPWIFLKMGLACIPCFCFGLLYVLL